MKYMIHLITIIMWTYATYLASDGLPSNLVNNTFLDIFILLAKCEFLFLYIIHVIKYIIIIRLTICKY